MSRLLIGTFILAAIGLGEDGSIGGTVVDRSGFAIANTSVTITGTTTKVITDSKGKFLLKGLQAGAYALTFDAPGFKVVTRDKLPMAASGSNHYPVFVLDVDLSRAICVLDITGEVPSAAQRGSSGKLR